jgi:glycosyltransferase involved in cell wall biosynthesis
MANESFAQPVGAEPVELSSESSTLSLVDLKGDSVCVDVSDLVYYIGHHSNLTGIQRVQANFARAAYSIAPRSVKFLAWNVTRDGFDIVDSDLLMSILWDLNFPEHGRTAEWDRMASREGVLPGSTPLGLAVGKSQGMKILLLGAAWVIGDYFAKIMELKRTYGATFYMTVHDLIPIYASDTCDQNTAVAFRSFLLQSAYVVDHYVCVSKNTQNDLLRFFKHSNLAEPSTTVINSGCEVFDDAKAAEIISKPALRSDEPFILFVSTIEGRKNHILAYKTWEKLAERDGIAPRLVCVGRYGWRADEFLGRVVSTDGLNGKIEILSDIPDGELEWLYANCLFTIYPSVYEGWGLPISESLARGKVCVASGASAMPEAGGDLALYIDVNDPDDLGATIVRLLDSPQEVAEREAEIRTRFTPRPWSDVAAEYLQTLADFEPHKARSNYVTISLGREYVVRSLPQTSEVVGNELQRLIEATYRGPILGRPLGTDQMCDGLYLRGRGKWLNPEHWGNWLGLGGGSLDFWWPGESADILIAVLGEALPNFAGKTVRLTLNGRTHAHPASGSSPYKELRIAEMPLRKGLNRLVVDMELAPEDHALARGVDGRGPMWSIVSVAFIDPSNVQSRLALLEKQFQRITQ